MTNRFPFCFLASLCIISLTCSLFPEPVQSQQDKSAQPRPAKSRFWDNETPFNPKVPTPAAHFGHEIGFRHLDHAQVVSYLNRIAEVSDRLSIRQYATTHGGRPLYLLTITSPKNRKRLESIRKQHRQLATRNASEVDIENLPAVINMGYGVHGDESSATNCTPLVAYYLAAAQTEEVSQWLDHCVIQLDPSLNPDGFNRFANWAKRYRGRVANPDPQHAEHNQMWPPGRVNYYWFDLNRDWLPLVHPESRGRLNNFHRWKPNVVLDFHEMGSSSTYFFQPGIPSRTNPLTPVRNQELTRQFATYHAKELDKIGSLYFTQERFDDFYMGKGSTYPDLHGSVGILFEQASARGHVQKTGNGLLAFHDTIKNQFTTSLTSLRATTDLRKTLLNYKRGFYTHALKLAQKSPIKTFVFTSPKNRTRLTRFADILHRHDIDCYRPSNDSEYGDQIFIADETLVVPANQPEYRFLKSLLQRQTNFRENIFYDVSTWTLPLAYGLDQHNLKRDLPPESLLPFFSNKAKGKQQGASHFEFDKRAVAYAIDFYDDAACELLTRLLRSEIDTRVAQKPFQVRSNDQTASFDRGTLIVYLQQQKQKLPQIEKILRSFASQVRLAKVSTGLSVAGPDLGSSNFAKIQPPKLAMLSGPSMSSYSAGEIWHYVDHQLRFPLTILKDRSLTSADRLREYTCLIVPDGSITDSNWNVVQEYAKGGGNVVVIGRQAVAIQNRLAKSKTPSKTTVASEDGPGSVQQPFDSASNKRALQLISGAIFNTQADLTHPLLFGVSEKKHIAVFRNHNQFLKPSRNPYCNPMIYAKAPLMAGYCSKENQGKFESSASMVVAPVGKGQVILMADNPNFRGFWHKTRRIFLNAVLWGERSRVN